MLSREVVVGQQLYLVTTSRWALGTAARTASRYDEAAEPKTAVTTR